MLAPDLEALSRRVVPDSRCTNPPPPIPAEFFLWTELAQHGYESCAASKRPGCSPIGAILKLANSWQIGFLKEIPGKGKSDNSRVFIDLNGGPGWT